MPHWLHFVFFYFWIAPRVLLLVLIYALFRSGLRRQFPIFSLYATFQVAETLVLLVVYLKTGSFANDHYTAFYSVVTALSAGLRFGVIYEVYVVFFQDYTALRQAGASVLRWTAVGLLLAGAVLASVSGNTSAFLGRFWVLDRTVSLLQCGLFALLLVFARYFALSGKNYAFGIAFGFGFYESANLAIAAIRAETSRHSYFLDSLGMAAYHLCVVAWLAWLRFSARSAPPKSLALPENDLESWNQELRRLLR